MYRLKRETVVPRTLEETFAFFSNAENLGRITPQTLGFEILTPVPIAMAEGTLIDYQIRLHGIPLQWQTEITRWRPPHEFEDVQRKGPYRRWFHRHRFQPLEDGRSTSVVDEIEYELPFGFVGRLFSSWVVRDLDRIFDYRTQMIHQLLGRNDGLSARQPDGDPQTGRK